MTAFLNWAYLIARQFAEVGRTGIVLDPVSVYPANHSLLTVTKLGSGLGLLGVLLLCIAVFGFGFAAPWLRRILLVGMAFLLVVVPFGTVVAIVLFFILRRHSQVFSRLAAA